MFSAEILPPGISGSPLFVSMQMAALAALVLGVGILYLRNVGEGSFGEGYLVGLSWIVVMIALDLAHSVAMTEMIPDPEAQAIATIAGVSSVVDL